MGNAVAAMPSPTTYSYDNSSSRASRQSYTQRSGSFSPPSNVSNQVQCSSCRRQLLPPASSPHLFRCPCGGIVRIDANGQVQPNNNHGHGGSNNRRQCQNCMKWLIPPAGAPRFRCTCGNILVNSQVMSGGASESQSQSPSSSSGAVHARCPRCTQTLVAPTGHLRFRCPCGQMLALTQSRLRCPQCTVVLLPPPGAQQFRCPCGVVLRTPAAQIQMSVQTAADSAAPQARAVTRGQLDLSNLDNLKLGREAVVPRAKEGTINDAASIQKLESLRERMLRRHEKKWEQLVDQATLQTIWKLNTTSAAAELVDESENHAWVRSLREDGTLAWRDADKVDSYVRDAATETEYAKKPSVTVQEAVIAASKLPFGQKLSWFRRQIERLKVEWQHGHQTIRVKRSNLLETSTHAVMQIPPSSFHQIFRFEFVGEPAKDAGGVAREWYDQLTKTLFNPDFGLFKTCSDMATYTLNSSSGTFNDHHLLYFRFAGRLMGKALFDGQLINAHLTKPLYKHLLGHPLMAADLEFVDSELFHNLRALPGLDEDDIEGLCKTFVVEKSEFGVISQHELKPGGAEIEVRKENLLEYAELLVEYYLFRSMREQLQHLLQGFYEVMPHYLVSVFDSQELEVLLCGLDRVDMDDWRKHTEFRGHDNELHAKHELVNWFFECCEEMSDVDRSKLLQWCTGCARVPIEGFVALQSHDGERLAWLY
eukprot:INCI17527.1.p1 GENE.INCI17527.1~~INCI17527.1.p1  ORF type:complete len:707 (+),score=109.33 INCI17527.1:221-2341(+)